MNRLCQWLALGLLLGGLSGNAADSLDWNAAQNRVSADIKSGDLSKLLGQIAAATGWQVYVEPGLQHPVSAKFSRLAPGEALRLLLGDLNFALVPETNHNSRLLVFQTVAQNATRRVPPALRPRDRVIPNELIVRLKPGARIEDVARLVGGKVLGRIGNLNAYRLQFDDADAAKDAREQLAANPDVAAVENNYWIEAPPPPALVGSGGPPPPPHLELKPPPSTGRIIIGLVDTSIQPLSKDLQPFVLNPVSVAGTPNLDPNEPSHGTTMADTMLRSIQDYTKGGTAIQILPVDVYGPNPTSSTFAIAQGIVQAVDGGARIINLSLGSPDDSPLLHQVIQDAAAKNVLFVGAAGNSGVSIPFFPAAYPEVDSVTALDNGQLPAYANRGPWIAYAAPGTSTIYFNNQPWSVIGTSASAAYLSGAIGGYMEASHSSPAQAQAFVRSHFGISFVPARP